MVAQHDGRSADTEMPRLTALKFLRQFAKIGKERRAKGVKFFARRRQRERPALKQCHAKKFLQLRHLRAHRRLLDAIRNVSHRRHDAAVFGDVIKKFEVMDVHYFRRCS